MKYAGVLLDQNLSKVLDYAIPETVAVQVGMRVEVPLRGKLIKGTVAEVRSHSELSSVKSIARVLEGGISEPLWKLASWMSGYYATPLQRVLKCFVPVNERKGIKPQKRLWVSLAVTHEEALRACAIVRGKSPSQANFLEALLKRTKGALASSLLEEVQAPRSCIDALCKKGWIEVKEIHLQDNFIEEEEFFKSSPKTLHDEQRAALDAIVSSLSQPQFSVHLLHGVTGSGKTEVYLQAMQEALLKGKSALLMVPEISLTSQTIERIRSRFHERIAVLHHRRSLGERTHAWEELKKGNIRLAVGARSSVFAPLTNLGLIIVDEEHDSSYKQHEEMPAYSARDIAIMRAKLEGATVLLGSATPSLESYFNAERGRYLLHCLKTRATQSKLPQVHILDLKQARDRAGGFTHFSDELISALKKRLEAGEQSLLFLNRRGYHRLQMCGHCRAVVKCPRCDLGLTYHRADHLLACHLCDYTQAPPRSCSACGSSDPLQFQGFGTEHVERALHALLPGVRTLRMDRDTTRQKESHELLFQQFKAHKADVLIGTQMIAKGFHFPAATLVGVLHADASLLIPDFRAAESTFQLLTQVAGRAGRSDLPGEVIFQTYVPDHPILKLAAEQDYLAFYRQELEERRLFSYPPFCHLIKLLFSGPNPEAVLQTANQFREALTPRVEAEILPVSPAGHPKIKDRYRFQFLIKTGKVSPVTAQIQGLQSQFPLKESSLFIDVDPRSTW